MLASFVGAFIAGCSIHPIPDDVSPIPTEEIVANAHCELRLGIVDKFKNWFANEHITGIDPEVAADDATMAKLENRYGPKTAKSYKDYLGIAIAYDFDFDIEEHNNADANVGFQLPFTNSLFGLDASASLHKSRIGKRTFRSQETVAQLLTKYWSDYCHNEVGPIPAPVRPIYPLTGSIGLRKVAYSFLSIAELEGGQDSFVDTLTFTTLINGKVSPTIKIEPVPNSFRLVNAGSTLEAGRSDMHKVTVSLAFPVIDADPTFEEKQDALERVEARQGYRLNTLWRARYNLCVHDARNREDNLKTLRFTAPEVYCLEYASAFVPKRIRIQSRKIR